MKVRVADHLGMCFGVRDAITLALNLTEKGPITILGDLVHNPDVVSTMDARGALRAHLPAEVQTQTVLLTAHGTSERVRHELTMTGHEIHDAVCPLVTRAHTALRRLIAEGRHPVIIGQPGHVEVRGLVDDLEDYTIVLREADLDQLAGHTFLGVVSQTTQPLETVEALVRAMRRRFPDADIRHMDTVCQPTKDRQDALRQLAQECDVVVVVGGPESNNSRKLTELAQRLGRRAYQVANADDLRAEWFQGAAVVGVTAGTSTPDRAINEVRACLEAMPDSQPEEARSGLAGWRRSRIA